MRILQDYFRDLMKGSFEKGLLKIGPSSRGSGDLRDARPFCTVAFLFGKVTLLPLKANSESGLKSPFGM